MQFHEFSGEELEDIAYKFFIPVIYRTNPDFREQVALQELNKGLTLLQTTCWAPRYAVRTDRMAARASEGNRMLFAVQVAGRGRFSQYDSFHRAGGRYGVLARGT